MLSTLLCLATLGQPFLPGRDLSVGRAKAESRYIVAAEVGRVGDLMDSAEFSLRMWTELKPSSTLKGEVDRDELNRLPLSMNARKAKGERLPKSGETGIFFIRATDENSQIIKMLADTPANRASVRDTEPDRTSDFSGGGLGGGGLGGGGLGGGSWSGDVFSVRRPWVEENPVITYRTRAVPQGQASGDARKAQEAFAAEFSAHDPRPEERQAHFAWLFESETARRYGVGQVGWYGAVSKPEPRPGGGWLVTVTLHPHLRSNGIRHSWVSDEVRETYAFVDGAIVPISSDATTPRPDCQRFPLAY